MKNRTTILRWLIVIGLSGAVAVFFALGWQHQFTLAALKAHLLALDAFRQAHPWLLGGGFFLLYVAVTALSLPLATLLTLAGGAMFGLLEGTLLVSFASSIGATLAFLASRFVFRDMVQRRFGQRLHAVDEGIRREGALYLFTLRLVPVIPFFVVNLLMGLTRLPIRTFYWVSQLGMLAATVVFVNAGTQLARLHSLSGIVSPRIAGSLVLLGVFPWLARWSVARVRRRRLHAGWPAPKRFDRNLVVIGAGSAGLVSAYIAAAVRAKVTLVEGGAMGGDCLNTGCVPSKALIHAARLAAHVRGATRVGVDAGDIRVDFHAVMGSVRRAVQAVAPHDSVERYRGLGVEVQHGHARIVSPWTVEIDGRPVTTRAIVIATGAEPVVPDLPGLAEAGYLTSETLWQLQDPPGRLLILGGGPIGCELAQAFARLGTPVVQVQSHRRLLMREDDEVSVFVRARLSADGVDVRTDCRAVAVERHGGQYALVCEHEGRRARIPFDTLLVAVGRKPRVTGFGLEELGIPVTGTVDTDAWLATLYPNIYACGDVAGPYQFTHVAAHQAWYAAVNALFGSIWRFRVDYAVIPAVTFVDPEVARVGLNEREAKAQGIPFETTRYELDDLDRAITEDQAHGFVKVLTAPGKDRILGATIVGQHAGEMLAEFVLAMRHGLGLNKILGTIHAYPTWAEANKYAAGNWKKAHAPERVLHWLARYHAWRRK
ncbi:pyridine nucleotide-disulfide oxidoreductase [Rhodanobacter denitrificans]|uniref:Pyridine nucleotide-disulfide oxidoreductase n=1 Tax=Rhodanobacter denitrificans TaxID=666685 RepID=A0A368KFI9_9GAMM|nr:bifunctional TVP38/TMEM64 family protein/FAD-dependent oxidoreductase [Rhodanobacter denitrificans]RCS30671.1 pyridine nucleotide-disulfide oxidoreductase [Rhodanobacter denitrificans]